MKIFSNIFVVFFALLAAKKLNQEVITLNFRQIHQKILKSFSEYCKGKIAIFQCNIEKVLIYCAIKICNNEKVLQMQYFTEKSIAILQIVQ